MITASIVTYKSNIEDIQELVKIIINNINILYIVDNSPSDQLREIVSINPNIEYIFGQGNIGFGAAHNIAINNVINTSKYHFIINPDIKVNDNIFEPMIKYMESNKNIGMMMPKILNIDDSIQFLPKLLPSIASLVLRKIKIPRKRYESFIEKYELRKYSENQICNVPIISGCFTLLNLEAINKIGGYDERYFMYFEDFDLSRRIHQKYKTIYYPLVSVHHEYESGANKNWKLFTIFITSAIKYFNKWGVFDRERDRINKKVIKELDIQ